MTGYIGLDFETFSDIDITVHGLERYVKGQHFTPLIAATVEREDTAARVTIFDFVTNDYDKERQRLVEELEGKTIVAHNAGFEQAVLRWMDIDVPSERFIDSAVLARAAGAAGKLEAAAPQLLGVDKVAAGWDLIKLFSIPGKYQEANGNDAFDVRVVEDNGVQWQEFFHYCIIDAKLSLQLAELILPNISATELANNAITMDMNNTGWHVDVDLVRNMQLRYLTNVANTEAEFRRKCNAPDLNLNSHPQLVEWCAKRGVRATSFDEAHVERLIKQLERKLTSPTFVPIKVQGYEEVLLMLQTKQIMGGSSLKKLQTILDTVGADDRLHDQYLHIGAGATFRTSGRGVQMQNLKRLNGQGDDMAELWAEDVQWDNSKLASNLRQVFCATDPNGFLIVGDFSSVESRGLAWQAGEQWKLDAYAKGEDLYKVQAGLIFGKSATMVTKTERQIGKVGELACGYGAGGPAVREFASKMGVELSETEAAKLVNDWRLANPRIVDYWSRLHEGLLSALQYGTAWRVTLPYGVVRIKPVPAPESLRKQVNDHTLWSLQIRLLLHDDTEILRRVIHGTRIVGRNIHYWKPSERKTGDLWMDTWVNPKTKQRQPHTVYGGKLSGLLTQSLCREVFFDSLREVHRRLNQYNVSNVKLVGQFHDEIVLDWAPGNCTLSNAKVMLNDCMTTTALPNFPLAAEIKSDYRYTK